MPVVVACLVPAAPLLLTRLTGDRVPETHAVRAAVATALARLVGTDRLVVVAPYVPGRLDGFGGRPAVRPATVADGLPGTSWPHALAEELLATVPGVPTDRAWCSWPEGAERTCGGVASAGDPHLDAVLDVLHEPGRTGLLLVADGSRTRGARAPGGDDPRGAVVDAALAAALREQREVDVPDARAVGAAAAVPAVALLARLARDGSPAGPTELLLAEAPLGVGYMVAVLGDTGTRGRGDRG